MMTLWLVGRCQESQSLRIARSHRSEPYVLAFDEAKAVDDFGERRHKLFFEIFFDSYFRMYVVHVYKKICHF